MLPFALFALTAPFVVSAQQVHQVVVGGSNGELQYTPEAIFASPGDIVTFQFHQKNHSAVQSSFANPCAPAAGGFNSGYMPVAPDQTADFPEFNITVMDQKPIWVYCSQKKPASHCHAGMVFAVNCGATGSPNSFDNFKASAIAQGAAEGSAPAAPAATDSWSGSGAQASPVATATEVAPPAASSTGNVIKVIVGGNSTLTFNPSAITAQPMDTITFEFQSKNHTATQSTFANPCLRLNNVTTGQVGFDSGFMPVSAGATSFPSFSITVNNTAPTWVFCRQTVPISHCGTGMVLSINADESSTHSTAAFVALAKQINGTNAASSPAAASTSNPALANTSGAIRSTSFNALEFLALIGGLVMVMV